MLVGADLYSVQPSYPEPAAATPDISETVRRNTDRATFANERCGAIHLDHGESSASGGDGVAFSCVSLLSHSQCVQLRLEGAPIDYFRRSKFISHLVLHRSLRYIARWLGAMHAAPTVAPFLREERRLLESYEVALLSSSFR